MDSKDKDVLDLFMDDSLWIKRIKRRKKTPGEKQKVAEKPGISQDEITVKSDEVIDKKNEIVNEDTYTDTGTADNSEKEFGEVDYAILKSVTYGFKTIKQISRALQIRTLVVEKHAYKLIKEGLIKYFQHAVLTSRGKQAIEDFEKNNPEDVWKPIDEFIVYVIERNKERNLRLQKIVDIVLLVSTIILIILIIYFGVFS